MMTPRNQAVPMDDRVRHPRLLSAFRVVLYATAGTVALAVGVLAVATVGFVVAAGGLAMLVTGQAHLLAVLVLAGLVVATTGGLVWALAEAARRLDREVTEADRKPDPVEEAKRAYADGRLDEAQLERRLERLLGADAGATAAEETVSTVDRSRPTGSRGGLRERADADGRG